MPRGFQRSRQHREMVDAKMAMYSGARVLYFGLEPGESGVVRFLEQGDDTFSAYVHRIDVKGRDYPVEFVCLDQDEEDIACPGCEGGHKRVFKGFLNIIWRDAPVWKTDENDRLVKDKRGNRMQTGTEDQVALWKCSWTTFEELDGKDADYKGLKSRDFVVTRHGTGMKTKYRVEPFMDDDGNAPRMPLSEKDKELEADKYDLDELTTPPKYNQAKALMSGDFKKAHEDEDAEPETPTNIFAGAARSRRGASSDTDE